MKESSDKSTDQSQKRRYSPAVLRMAQEHEIDLEHVTDQEKVVELHVKIFKV